MIISHSVITFVVMQNNAKFQVVI